MKEKNKRGNIERQMYGLFLKYEKMYPTKTRKNERTQAKEGRRRGGGGGWGREEITQWSSGNTSASMAGGLRFDPG